MSYTQEADAQHRREFQKCPYCGGKGYIDEGPDTGLCPWCADGEIHRKPLRLTYLRIGPLKKSGWYKEAQERRKVASANRNKPDKE